MLRHRLPFDHRRHQLRQFEIRLVDVRDPVGIGVRGGLGPVRWNDVAVAVVAFQPFERRLCEERVEPLLGTVRQRDLADSPRAARPLAWS